MDQHWTRCQRMIQHEQDRYEQLKTLAIPINDQLARYIFVQPGATNPNSGFRAIEQVLQELSILQRKYMLHVNPPELDLLIRVLLKLRFKIRGRAKLEALVEELRRYNDCIERRLTISYPPQGPRPPWPAPAPHLGFY